MRKYLLVLIIFILVACNFNSTNYNREEDKNDAEKITQKFYSLIKENKRVEIFSLFGDKFYSITSKQQLGQMLDNISSECGDKISDIKLQNWETSVTIGTNSKSQYVLLYQIQRDLKPTKEKITLEKVKGDIKIVGYNVNIAE